MNTAPDKLKVYIVDDDIFFLEVLQQTILTEIGEVEIRPFLNPNDCLQEMKQGNTADILLLDNSFQYNDEFIPSGMDVIRKFKSIQPSLTVFMISGASNVVLKCLAKENGAADWFCKDNELPALLEFIYQIKRQKKAA